MRLEDVQPHICNAAHPDDCTKPDHSETLDGPRRIGLPTEPSVIRANSNGEMFFGPDAADQWVTLDGEWWSGCDLTDIRVLWTLESI